MKSNLFLACSVCILLSGCWTVSETEFPTFVGTDAKGVRVKLQNFRTGVYDYVPVQGHESMDTNATDQLLVGQDRMTQTDVSWLMQYSASGRLVSRTVAELKRRGYVIDIKKPQYVIEMSFAGPTLPDDDVLTQVGYGLGTLFTMEKMRVSWAARLTVRDGATNKALLEKDYEQPYEVSVWGPIPVASPACHEKNTLPAANSWAITALNDRAVADATAFIAARTK